ncbi:hypothetical protein C0993_004690 [Termitomyces sp. T159_Od127]|nr:hypothetical protein C0993_004690 [Termitomyces sp. T159_Od127]
MSSAATLDRETISTAAKKHKRSSSDLSVDELYSLTDGLTSILRKIEDAQKKYGDLEELHFLSDETKSTITQVQIFQNLKKKDPDAVIVLLSNMDEKILRERLGLREIKTIGVDNGSPIVFLENLLPALKAQSVAYQLDTIADVVNHHWNHASLLDTLRTIDTAVNKKSEAASRISIDAWLLQGIQLIQEIDIKYKSVLFPELLIWSRNSESDDPPVIRYEGQATFLAGSTDYAFLSVLPSGENVSDERVQARLLDSDNAVRSLHFLTDRDTLNIYEAKRASKSLEAHRPQVIAQCLAIMAKWNASHYNRIDKLPFTLTTGTIWLFGIVDSERMSCIMTAEMSLDNKALRIAAERKDPSDRSLQALMTLILIWSTQPGDVIKAAMTTLQ